MVRAGSRKSVLTVIGLVGAVAATIYPIIIMPMIDSSEWGVFTACLLGLATTQTLTPCCCIVGLTCSLPVCPRPKAIVIVNGVVYCISACACLLQGNVACHEQSW